jgi:hypothetical protein
MLTLLQQFAAEIRLEGIRVGNFIIDKEPASWLAYIATRRPALHLKGLCRGI